MVEMVNKNEAKLEISMVFVQPSSILFNRVVAGSGRMCNSVRQKCDHNNMAMLQQKGRKLPPIVSIIESNSRINQLMQHLFPVHHFLRKKD